MDLKSFSEFMDNLGFVYNIIIEKHDFYHDENKLECTVCVEKSGDTECHWACTGYASGNIENSCISDVIDNAIKNVLSKLSNFMDMFTPPPD